MSPHRPDAVRVRLALLLAPFVLAGLVLAPGAAPGSTSTRSSAASSPAAPDPSVLNQGTRTIDFDTGWKFALVNPNDTTDPSGVYGNSAAPHAQAVDFDDSSWRAVTLPHDWSIELLPQATGQSNATGYFQGGLGWYRKTFTLPPSTAGKRISLDFDGVYMNSYAYLNGSLLGNHPFGYTGFSFDVTSAVHTDGVTPNVLAVVVQNKQPSSRWYSGSGITRNVHLTVTDPIHVARFGTFVTTPNLETTIGSGYANVHVATKVVNETGADATVDVVSKVEDASGAVVAQTTTSGITLGSAVYTDTVDIRVDDPKLWSTENPNLYTLETNVESGGDTVDTYRTTFGMRWVRVDPNQGVFLNGEHIKLQGVDLHNDEGALGSVDNYDALYRQMSILKNMGVNSFRTSHNPPSPEWTDVCQRLGIVMMVEAFDAWGGNGKLANDYHLYFNQASTTPGKLWSDVDIGEMVDEAKNSPAVILWSIGNEIPSFTSTANLPVAQRLIDDIRAIDNTRPVVAGSDQYRSLPGTGSGAEQMLLKLDGLGLNYNPAKVVDALHAKYPTKFFFESESSSEESSRGIYQDPDYVNTGENYVPGKRLVSSYDNNLASWTMSNEYGLKKDRDRTYFAGQFIWSGFDYIGEPTPYGVFPVKASSFGAIDTAGFPKDSFYLFKTQWTPGPMVHLLPMNWTSYKPGENVQVWAYANVDTVELFLNGVSLGTKTFDHKTSVDGLPYLETTEASNDDKNYTTGTAFPGSYTSPNGSAGKLHVTWNVPFAPGTLVAVARKDGVEVARDEVETAGAPDRLRLTPEKTVIAANGKSLSYVDVDVVDEHGVIVPDAANSVDFTVTGAGTFAGADNGKQDSAEGYQSLTHAAFSGKLLAIVRSGTDPGPITVKASSDGLLPATTTLYASDESGGDLLAIRPVHVRSPLGSAPVLPAAVQGVHADGSLESLDVSWGSLPAAAGTLTGVYTVHGTVSGGGPDATAIVTVFKAVGSESFSTVVPAGTPPGLPATVRVLYNDGVTRIAAVAWDPVDPSQYASEGQFTVGGDIAGTAIRARASVRVTSSFLAGQNIARSTNPLRPAADAGYAGSTGSVPAGMLDGTTTTGGWSNAYNKAATNILPAVSKAHEKEWVSVGWPNPQRLGSLTAFFTTSASRVQPSAIAVSYWNGVAWAPVSNLSVTLASTSNVASSISFDPVSTTRVRLDLTSPSPNTSTGFMQITELQATADQVTYNTTASLTDLKVNGQTIAGFDPATKAYALEVGKMPTIEASAADNGRLAIVPPLSIPGTAIVKVISEEGLTQSTYSIELRATTTPPVVTITPDRAADHDGWYNHPVTFTATGLDVEGVAVACDPPRAYAGPDDAAASVTFNCHDDVGNTGTASADLRYDATAPVVAVTGPADGGLYKAGSVPAAGCDTTDATSGVAHAATVHVTGPAKGGIFTATCSGAEDGAGNTAEASVSYRVAFLLGTDALGSATNSNGAGIAEAFRFTAPDAGALRTLSFYIDKKSKSSKVIVGVYSDDRDHPGKLLAKGTLSDPDEDAWNTVTLAPTASVTDGGTYWIAILSGKGVIRYRDECCGGHGTSPSETNRENNLADLPSTWRTGQRYPDGPLSAYSLIFA